MRMTTLEIAAEIHVGQFYIMFTILRQRADKTLGRIVYSCPLRDLKTSKRARASRLQILHAVFEQS